MLDIKFTPTSESVRLSEKVYRYINQYTCSSDFKTEFKRRSHIFVPLNKPRYQEKVGHGEIPADVFIWDLEDSVPEPQKSVARERISNIPSKPGNVEYNVRINAGEPELLESDLQAISRFPFDSVTLPKGESADEVVKLMQAIGDDKNYVVTIETVKGLDAIDQIATVLRAGRDALGFGVGDMSTDLGIARIPTYESAFFQQILGIISLTGKKYGLDLFDSVSAKFNDPGICRREAELSRNIFGFTGKKLINPRQLAAINSVFSPTLSDINNSIATLEAFLGASKSNAQVVGGEYEGMPAFKAAERKIKKYLRQGYLVL